MWNKDTLVDYQVLGANLQSIMKGFSSFTLIASKILLEEGIGTADDTMMVQFEPQAWYPLDRFLRAFDRMNEQFGSYILRQVGLQIPKHSVFPPHVVDIHSGFSTLDIGYHLNHGKNGEPLFDPATHTMKEGIGHYHYTPIQGEKRLVCVGETPYPCPFEEGLVTALAHLFIPTATVVHDKAGCRAKGANSCKYTVTWK